MESEAEIAEYKLVLAVGDCGGGFNTKGHFYAPIKSMRAYLKKRNKTLTEDKRRAIYDVDEYRTSQKCSRCFSKLEKVVKTDDKHCNLPLFFLFKCMNKVCVWVFSGLYIHSLYMYSRVGS